MFLGFHVKRCCIEKTGIGLGTRLVGTTSTDVWFILSSFQQWILNNIIGLAFCMNAIELISLDTVSVGCLLLGGLFLYDIFWVFGTDVMVTVAKGLEVPIKCKKREERGIEEGRGRDDMTCQKSPQSGKRERERGERVGEGLLVENHPLSLLQWYFQWIYWRRDCWPRILACWDSETL
jgi:hypothetical protein